MDFDFGVLPPEINSARMYSGPGSTPLMAAASAWEKLATELHATATSYSSVIATITSDEWLGPASMWMATAAIPYVGWLRNTAAQAGQAAIQARSAASAYETALAMTVPPGVIAANRNQIMSLITTNVLGQNTPAIAANEAQYGEMWAQDTAAMEAYAGSSAAAATLTPFSSPLISNVATAAQSALAAIDPPDIPEPFAGPNIYFAFIAAGVIGGAVAQAIGFSSSLVNSIVGNVLSGTSAMSDDQGSSSTDPTATAPAAGGTTLAGNTASAPDWRGLAAAAAVGRAISVGALSAPPTWAVPPVIRRLAAGLSYANAGALPIVVQDQPDDGYADIASAGLMASLVGTSLAGLVVRADSSASPAAATPAAGAAAGAAAKPPPARILATPAIPSAAPAPALPAGVAESLAATLAAIPGATIVVIPPSPAK